MKKVLYLLSFLFLSNTFAQTAVFDSLLKKHVDTDGNVNYAAFKKDENKLQSYLDYLAKTSPADTWSKNREKAFWINAYNAYTIKLILDHYPLKSILKIKKKGKDAWNITFAKVGGNIYTLNEIEHEILRKKFNDPKIHVGVNCASASCPQLGNFAFTEANYHAKTTELMKKFINDPSRNKIAENILFLSKIFEWFKEDFTKKGSLISFLNKYANTKINKGAKISHLEYNWNLNEK